MRHRPLVLLLLTAACLSVSVASAKQHGPVLAPTRIVRPNLVQRPAIIMLSGDGTWYVQGIKWDDWGGATATAIGTLMVNDCRPSCAQSSRRYRFAAHIRATATGTISGRHVYRQIIIELPPSTATSRKLGVPLTMRLIDTGKAILPLQSFKQRHLEVLCKVPNVVGFSVFAASVILTRAHCNEGTVSRPTSPLPGGAAAVVGTQTPKAGTSQRDGDLVALTLKVQPQAAASIPGSQLVKDEIGNLLQVTVTALLDPAAPADEYSTPDAGNRLVSVRLRLSGRRGTVSDNVDYNGVVILGSNDQLYSPFGQVAGCTDFDDGNYTVSPGEQITGCVTFEIPDSVQVRQVQFSIDSDDGVAHFNN